jgi:uncharacterized protein (DUF697 family)
MDNLEDMTTRLLIASKESLIPLPVPEKPIITILLQQLTTWIKSLFSFQSKPPNVSGIFTKLTIVGAGRVLSLFYEIRMLILHF